MRDRYTRPADVLTPIGAWPSTGSIDNNVRENILEGFFFLLLMGLNKVSAIE